MAYCKYVLKILYKMVQLEHIPLQALICVQAVSSQNVSFKNTILMCWVFFFQRTTSGTEQKSLAIHLKNTSALTILILETPRWQNWNTSGLLVLHYWLCQYRPFLVVLLVFILNLFQSLYSLFPDTVRCLCFTYQGSGQLVTDGQRGVSWTCSNEYQTDYFA